MLVLLGIAAIVIGLARARAKRADDARWRRWLALPIAGVASIAVGAPRGLLLTKSIGYLAMPLGLIWSALFALILVETVRNRWRYAAVFAALFVALTAAGNEPLSDVLDGVVEGEHATTRPFAQGRFDAVIVLGGGTDDRPGGEVELADSGDRVMLGARLYHAGLTPLLLTSGSPIEGLTTHDAAAATARMWRQLGIPESAIVEVDGARTTSEEARLHAAVLRRRNLTRVGLVTSASHMRRALGLFAAVGLRPIPLPADVHGRPFEWRGFYSVVPHGKAAERIHHDAWELVGRLAGR